MSLALSIAAPSDCEFSRISDRESFVTPDENEAVVDYLLRRFDSARIEPLDALKAQLPNAVGSVTEWNNKAYHPDVAHSLRLGPSSTIEAFFVAKLTKAVSTNI